MTRGARLVVTTTIDTGDGYECVPVREGEVIGHPVGDPSRVWVQWMRGREGRQLMRTEEAALWVTSTVRGSP